MLYHKIEYDKNFLTIVCKNFLHFTQKLYRKLSNNIVQHRILSKIDTFNAFHIIKTFDIIKYNCFNYQYMLYLYHPVFVAQLDRAVAS